jgi:hypothetical protein
MGKHTASSKLSKFQGDIDHLFLLGELKKEEEEEKGKT